MITRHDIEPSCYYIPEEKFPAVVQVENHRDGDIVVCHGMGMLIHPEWILTAAHVAHELTKSPPLISIGNKQYSIKTIVVHPDWQDSDAILDIKNDIALLQLERPVAGTVPLSLYRDSNEVGQIATFVGWGDGGNGLVGVIGPDGQLRQSNNRVEEADSQWLVFRFDDPTQALGFEGISGPGDSGGPALIKTETGWLLAGISCAQSSEAEYRQEDDWRQQEEKEGIYGVWEYYTRISSYLDWIHSTISQSDSST